MLTQIMQSYWNHIRTTKDEVADAPPTIPVPE